jgi:hypothetical protein
MLDRSHRWPLRSRAPLLAALALCSLGVSACSSSSGSDPSAPESTGTPPPPPPSEPVAAEPAAPSAPRGAPSSAQDCTNLVTDIVNDPPLDGGVAMNNATTAGDAGGSDRLVPIMQTIQKEKDAFRCCFDLWGKEHKGEQAKIALVLEIDPAGKLTKAGFKQAETDLKDDAVEACMSDVAKKMSFPPSPSGKETTYTHRFEFKARVFGH